MFREGAGRSHLRGFLARGRRTVALARFREGAARSHLRGFLARGQVARLYTQAPKACMKRVFRCVLWRATNGFEAHSSGGVSMSSEEAEEGGSRRRRRSRSRRVELEPWKLLSEHDAAQCARLPLEQVVPQVVAEADAAKIARTRAQMVLIENRVAAVGALENFGGTRAASAWAEVAEAASQLAVDAAKESYQALARMEWDPRARVAPTPGADAAVMPHASRGRSHAMPSMPPTVGPAGPAAAQERRHG